MKTTLQQQRVTKTMVKKAFNELKKYGYRVIHFSFRKYLPRSIKDVPDIWIIDRSRGRMIFVENKLYQDSLSPGQEEMQDDLCEVVKNNMKVYSFIATENNYLLIRDSILENRLDYLQ